MHAKCLYLAVKEYENRLLKKTVTVQGNRTLVCPSVDNKETNKQMLPLLLQKVAE
jgi:hypothetical protein